MCANCGTSILWMGTLNAWIHASTGHGACKTREHGGHCRRILTSICGRGEVAFPSQRPSSRHDNLETAQATHWDKRREVNQLMLFDDIFEDDVVMEVPSAAAEYERKAPGYQDSNGDHCAD